jgi:hypothetical protein
MAKWLYGRKREHQKKYAKAIREARIRPTGLRRLAMRAPRRRPRSRARKWRGIL